MNFEPVSLTSYGDWANQARTFRPLKPCLPSRISRTSWSEFERRALDFFLPFLARPVSVCLFLDV